MTVLEHGRHIIPGSINSIHTVFGGVIRASVAASVSAPVAPYIYSGKLSKQNVAVSIVRWLC